MPNEEKQFIIKRGGGYVQGYSFVKRNCKITEKEELAIKMSKFAVDKFIKFCKEVEGEKPDVKVIEVKGSDQR